MHLPCYASRLFGCAMCCITVMTKRELRSRFAQCKNGSTGSRATHACSARVSNILRKHPRGNHDWLQYDCATPGTATIIFGSFGGATAVFTRSVARRLACADHGGAHATAGDRSCDKHLRTDH